MGVESRLMGVKLDTIENSMRGYVGRRGQELGAPVARPFWLRASLPLRSCEPVEPPVRQGEAECLIDLAGMILTLRFTLCLLQSAEGNAAA